ncbi:MAG: leucine-rich repeat domain-containing protein [Clostridia bacterium]|nr:leucine-rich repeat domain-containing protein [Clostridia bacterium]
MFNNMKKKLVLLLAAISCISCGAIAGGSMLTQETQAETVAAAKPTLEIISNNVSYSESIYILYAVDHSGFDRTQDKIKMLFWNEVQEEYILGSEDYVTEQKGVANVKGDNCAIFYSHGLAAKEMTDDIYSRAYVEIDGKTYYSDVVKYSVLDYVYDRRANGGLSAEEEVLYNYLLGYGGAAQNNFGYNTDRPANATYHEVHIRGGKCPDGFGHGRYKEGDRIWIKANEPEHGKCFWYWKNKNGIVVSYDREFEIEIGDDEEYEAVYKDISEATTQIELATEVDYDDKASDIDLPKTVSFEHDGKKVTLEVAWHIDAFVSKKVGTQLLYADLVDESAYETYGIAKDGVVMIVSTLPYTFTANGLSCTLTGYYGYDNNLVIPSMYKGVEVKMIAQNAFANALTLQKVVVPNTVTIIESAAFKGCENITSITLPFTGESDASEEYTWLGYIFGSEDYLEQKDLLPIALKEVILTGTLTKVADYAFYGCDGLNNIVLPDSITEIGDSAFYSCDSLATINIPQNLISIGKYAFQMCDSLTELILPDGLETIGSRAFYYCDNLLDLVIPNSVTSIGAYAFSNCDKLKDIIIPASITDVAIGMFVGCNRLKSVQLPNTLNSIGSSAFENCVNLTNIVIPSTVNNIGKAAFANCGSLIDIVIPESVTNIDEAVFKGCNGLTEVIIPDTVLDIAAYAFASCENVKNILIGSAVKTIDNTALFNCYNLTDITVKEDNAIYQSINGNLYTKDGKTLVQYAIGKKESSVVISDEVEVIDTYAFRNSKNMIHLEIADSVTEIKTNAFENCKNLFSIVLGETLSLLSDTAFAGCNRIVEIYNKSGLTITKGDSGLGKYALGIYTEAYESKLSIDENGYAIYTNEGEKILVGYTGTQTDLVLPSTVTKIDKFAFAERQDLTSVVISAPISYLGNYAFYGCTNLTSVEIGGSVSEIGMRAFSENEKLLNVTLPSSVRKINTHAFEYCFNLKNVYYLGDVASWCAIKFGSSYANPIYYGDNFYINGTFITALIIPEGVTTIGDYAFDYYGRIKNITLPASLGSIGYSAFTGCGIKEVYYLGAIEDWCNITLNAAIGTEYYINGELVSELVIPNDINCINKYTFANWDNLTSVVIPATVTQINLGAFAGCDNLKKVYYQGSIADWCNIIFEDVTANPLSNSAMLYINNELVTEISPSDNITNVNDYAFYGNIGLKNVSLGDTVGLIGEFAFAYCNELEILDTGDSLIQISNWAFAYCEKLLNATLGTSVSTINTYAFYYCKNLNWITLPVSVTEIGIQAFLSCDKLTSVYYQGSIEEWNNINILIKNQSLLNATRYYLLMVDPTCGKNGYTAYVDGDGNIVELLETVEATGEHEYDKIVVEPNCTQDGYTVYICVDCGNNYTDDLTPSIGEHSYKQEIVAATCEKEGSIVYTCSGCGDSYTEEIPALSQTGEHTYEESTIEPTCGKEGATIFVCLVCGDSYSYTIPATGEHEYHPREFVQPTCTKDGYYEHVCNECGDSYRDIILAHHSYDPIDTILPTCTEGGYHIFECTECGDSYTDVLSPTGHDYVGRVDGLCTENGTIIYICSWCEDSYTEDWVATDHRYVGEVVLPTCKEEGYHKATCSMCGDTVIEIMPPEHNYEVEFVRGSCTEDGYIMYTCWTCGDSYQGEILPAEGHFYNENIITDYTCTTDGYAEYTCWECGDSYREVLPAAHRTQVVDCDADAKLLFYQCTVCQEYTEPEEVLSISVSIQVQATCVNEGQKKISVRREGEQTTYIYNVKIPVSEDLHEYSWTVQENGNIIYTCVGCGNSYIEEVETIECDHTYEVVDADVEASLLIYECSQCGESTTTEEEGVEKLVHRYTPCSSGYMHISCIRDGIEYGWHLDLPALEHSGEVLQVVEPTCGEGYTEYMCTVCGEIYRDNFIEGTGEHDYEEMKRVEPTCGSGYIEYQCKSCGESYQEYLEPVETEHAYEEVGKIEADCINPGFTDYCCAVCGEWKQDNWVEPTGEHKYEEMDRVEPTETEDGYVEYICPPCGDCYQETLPATGEDA